MEKFWSKAQDPTCKRQIEDLTLQIQALGKVVDEVIAENSRLKEELSTRHQVLSEDMSSMETRIVTRIEELENPLEPSKDPSNSVEESMTSGGFTRWSDRKRTSVNKEADTEAFLNHKKKPVAQEK